LKNKERIEQQYYAPGINAPGLDVDCMSNILQLIEGNGLNDMVQRNERQVDVTESTIRKIAQKEFDERCHEEMIEYLEKTKDRQESLI
jgi:hypothetical protein